MKTLMIFCTLCLTLAMSLRASNPKKITLKQTLEQQIASYISYPEVLLQAESEGVVVIRFRIDANNRLTDLQVYDGEDGKLNATLIKQLNGKKVFLTEPNHVEKQEYQARLHFRLK
ncbi:energy transducer TonB [Larkinella soli]|uniref:energy transducer TonB n=1 Tax=Larkinella soli TaxID=1770527 RepID=UPI000FFBD6D8|nr:energy transducer TonB [Larkinella soli]